MLVNIENLYKYYNGEPLLKDINLTVEDRETVGLIGANGCGKSTLLNIITGREGFDKTPEGAGSVTVSGTAKVGFLQQNSGIDTTRSIKEEMLSAFDDLIKVRDRMRSLESQMSSSEAVSEKINQEYAQLSAYFEARDGYRIDVNIRQVLNGMGFGDESDDRITSSLSGGEKTRLALARLLLEEPNLLILDEPTNHLDFKTLMWLEDYLKSYRGAIIVVSHDRYFLNKVCSRICEIENGRLTSYRGDYSAYLVQKKMNTERQLKEYEAQQKEIAKLEDYIVRNKTRASTAKMARSRQHMLDRMERVEQPAALAKPPKIRLEYDIEPTKDIVKVTDCPVIVGEGDRRKTLVESLNMHIRRGDHTAIIGDNGIGKTTILKLIQGLIPRSGGDILWGNNVKISYFDQEHSGLDPRDTVMEAVDRKFPRLSQQEVRNMLGSVLFSGEDVFKPVSVISGGERAKLCFALMAFNRGNVLILDEPTNHIDLNTKEVLEEALAEFEGTIILVSHDRYLLNRTADKIVEITADGARLFEGNFDLYADTVRREAQAAEQAEQLAKQEQQKMAYQENKQIQYRSKEQRAADAKRRLRIKELENEIEQLETTISLLEEEISTPEVAADHEVMSEKCSRLEECRNLLDSKMEEWAELG